MATRDDVATSKKKREVEELLKACQVDVSKSENRFWVWKVMPPIYKEWQATFTKKEEREGGSLGSVFFIVDILEGTKMVTDDIDPTIPSEMIKISKNSKEEDTSFKIERSSLDCFFFTSFERKIFSLFGVVLLQGFKS